MRKKLPKVYDFYPRTWVLPLDRNEFVSEFKKRKNANKSKIRRKNNDNLEEESNRIFIAKPEASSQGKGIFLITSLADIPKDERYVIQEYINE